MNFSNTTALGKLVRLPLRLVPRTAVVPVLSGPLRGARWIVGAATHGSWLGTYEAAKQLLIERALKPGSVFYDVGANAGFTYAVVKPPAGYESAESQAEVEIKIVYGQRRADHEIGRAHV